MMWIKTLDDLKKLKSGRNLPQKMLEQRALIDAKCLGRETSEDVPF